ncbi:MAG: alpha/beta hydrolase [Proteobacteria bacterium]|nr:alpha/beta hydrolase [Pseudomonadota bacterium]
MSRLPGPGHPWHLRTMERTDVTTRLGIIPLWAPPGALASEKPFMLVITGAWAEPDDMIRTPGVLGPAWDGGVMRLPGNGTPHLAETSIAAWAAAVDELIGTTLAGRPVVVVGLSVGALVALAVRAPQVKRIGALEPPLVMSKLWPMRERLLEGWRDHPQERPLLQAVFGMTGEGGLEERTWFHLFEGAAPVDVVLGGAPLMPPRNLPRFPSFVDEPERAWLAAQPGVRTYVIPGVGHNIHVFAPYELLEVLKRLQAAALA